MRVLVAALFLVLAGCQGDDDTTGEPDAARGDGGEHVVDAAPGTPDGCGMTCSQVSCGTLLCGHTCQAGSGCVDCTTQPCGTSVCFYGSGCFCGGQPCQSSGCPPGSGCLP